MPVAAWCGAGATSSPRPTPISVRRLRIAPSALPATTSPAAIAISRPERRSSASRCWLPGLGTGNMPELERAADPVRGEASYTKTCVACHGPNGAGIRRSLPTTDLGYMMPPLWGSDSFNDGAEMARLITAANFLHFNMPHGVDYLNPQLSPEQSWDIAAYVLSQPRPHKAGLDKDFPDLLEKPVDAPYGPYADGFSEQQHKYGPFAPIRAAIAKLKAEKAGAPSPPARCPILRPPLRLDLVPDHGRHVRAAEIFHRADAGRRGDVDLGEVTVNHVDADEEEPALAQRGADPGTDLALARGQLGLL